MPKEQTKPASALTRLVTGDVLKVLDGPEDGAKLLAALTLLSKWRAKMVENTIKARDGSKVFSGPFKGMIYGQEITEGAGTPRLLGCYEPSLIPIIEEIIAQSYPQVMDIGCAEGYYSVGLALRMAKAKVIACDINPKAQQACQALAEANNVADRVTVRGRISHADFDMCKTQKTLIFCDIEGEERDVLDPDKAPGLKVADILVETHEVLSPGVSTELEKRFAKSHRVTRLDRSIDMSALPDWMDDFSDLDRLLAVWESRGGPTPWLWMKSKKQP